MKSSTLILRSLTHYWRIHVAVFFGVIAGTAVISGALIVGDSVRESLKAMSLERLGGVDLALHSPRFIQEELAHNLVENPAFQMACKRVAPALIMEQSCGNPTTVPSPTGPAEFASTELMTDSPT
jgi:putative ABC transport system permease protein